MRDRVDFGADAFLNVGRAIDHRVEQIHHDDFAGYLGRAGARQFMLDDSEGPRVVIAHGAQPMFRQDEGYRRGLRGRGVGLAHQRRGHVARAVLDIEAAGDLDLLHFLARRHRDAQELFDQLVFRHRRRDQIDPYRLAGKAAPGSTSNSFKRCAEGNVDREHGATLICMTGPENRNPLPGSCAPRLSWPDPAATRKT